MTSAKTGYLRALTPVRSASLGDLCELAPNAPVRSRSYDASTTDDVSTDKKSSAALRSLLPAAPRRPLPQPPPTTEDPYTGRPPDASTTEHAEAAKERLNNLLRLKWPGAKVTCEHILPIGYSATTPLKVRLTTPANQTHHWFAKVANHFDDARAMLGREAVWTAWGATSEISPRVIEYNSAHGYLITELIGASPGRKSMLLEQPYFGQLMAGVRRLHDAPSPVPMPAMSPVVRSRNLIDAFVAASESEVWPSWQLSALRAYAGHLESLLPGLSPRYCAQHGDLQDGNLLVDTAKQEAYIIDYGLGCFADPMEDLAYFAISVFMPMQRAEEMYALYRGDHEDIYPDDLSRLKLQIALSRLERAVRARVWWPTDHQMHTVLAQHLNWDLDGIRVLLTQKP